MHFKFYLPIQLCKFTTSFFFAIIFFAFASGAQSQTPIDEATREINRPLDDEWEQKLKPEPITPKIETPAILSQLQGIKFFIKEIQLIGNESLSPQDLDFIIEKYENHEVASEELNKLLNEIKEEYLRRGFIATCFIPPQTMENGILMIQVVEAKMGELHIKKHKYFKSNRIKYYWKQKPDEVIRYSKISQGLFLINKNPDRDAKVILHKGEKPKTTDVTLDVTTNFPAHLTYSFDNEGVTSTGKERNTFGAKHNNFLGFDDTLLGGYIYGRNFESIYTYHSVPVTNHGTSLLYGHSYSKAAPKKEYTSSGVYSNSRNINLAVYQDLFKNGGYLGDFHFGIDAKDKTIFQNSGTTTRDRLRILNFGSSFVSKGLRQGSYLTFQISQGINGLGARRLSALSSREAKNVFTKFNLTLQQKMMLPLGFQGSFQWKTQVASNRLTPQEEFYLGGLNSVRGYPSGDFLADDAMQENFELLIPAFFIPQRLPMPFSEKSFKDNVTFVGFFDHGWGNKRNNLSTEKDTTNLMSTGAGLRIHLFNRALLRLEWGFPIGDKTISESSTSRFHFAIDFES